MRDEKVRQMPISELVPLDAHNRRVWGDYMEWFEGVLGGGVAGAYGEEDLEEDADEDELEDEEE